jgi:hypothetical protein
LSRFTVLILLVLLAALLVPLLAACSTQGDPPSASALDGKTLVEERCSLCHPLSRVTQARKTEQGWRQTVQRMVSYGAQLNPQQEQVVIQYLAETYPGQ